MEWIFYVLPGLAVAAVSYLVYVAATKGLPAAIATAKAWWSKGKQDLATVRGDVAEAHDRLAKLEARVKALEVTPAAQPLASAAAPAPTLLPVGG